MNDEDLNARREQLKHELRDRKYSDEYADNVLFETVSSQVQALRRQRGMTQELLAERIGSKQPRISYVESPKSSDEWPNWEVSTLNRIAHALGVRLKITFESHGSLVDEVGVLTTESLRKPDHADDPVLFPLPPAPGPNPNAPERTRWMQELMIPWLWSDRLDLQRLYDWLRGSGLPPVGHDEEPYQWLLRGLAIQGPERQRLEKRFAERLSILLGEEPDLAMREGGEDFLRNLYWTCAGLVRPDFLAEHLWKTYRRLGETKLRGDIRDALQAALVQNQHGDRPLNEIWEPMVKRGRHQRLRGGEIVGYEGILMWYATVDKDIDKVLWALGQISKRWEIDRKPEFKRLLWKVPDMGNPEVYRRLRESCKDWPAWARAEVPIFHYTDESMTASVTVSDVVFYANWPEGGELRTGAKLAASDASNNAESGKWTLRRRPKAQFLLNALATDVSSIAREYPTGIGLEAQFVHAVILAKAREAGA